MSSKEITPLDQISSDLPRIPLKAVTLSVVLAACVYLAMGVLTELDSVLQAIGSIPPLLYVALIGLSLISYLARFSRWLIFLRPVQPEISVRVHASIYFAGFALTTTPGKAGETIRSLYLRPLGIKYPMSLAAFFSERLLDVVIVTSLALLAMGAVSTYSRWYVSVAFVFIALFLLMRSKRFTVLLKRPSKRRFGVLAGEFQGYVNRFLSNRMLCFVIPPSAVAWICQGVSLALIVDSFGYDFSIWVIVGIYCISILAGAATFIPGGIGATEAAIALLLSGIGMDPTQAVAASIISRVVTLWFAIAIGMLALSNINNKASMIE